MAQKWKSPQTASDPYLLGPIPAELQEVTIDSAGLVAAAHQAGAGKAFIAYLASPRSSLAISATGLEPIVQPQ